MNILSLAALSLWAGLVLGLAATAIQRLFPGLTPGRRYRLWYLVFAGMLFLPPASLLWPSPGPLDSPPQGAPAAALETSQPPPVRPRGQATIGPRTGSETLPGARSTAAADSVSGWDVTASANLAAVVLWIWLAGTGLGWIVLMHDGWQLARLRRRSVPPSRQLLSIWTEAVAAVRTGRRLRLLVSDEVVVPLACGWRRPAVIVPAGLEFRMGPDEVRQLLMHELAHLSRGDDWHLAAQRVGRSVAWWHPVLRWVGAKLEAESELACDDIVAERTSRQGYARTLVRMAGLAVTRPGLAPAASRGHLSQRVERLLRPAERLPSWRRTGDVLLSGMVLAGAVRFGPPSIGLVDPSLAAAGTAIHAGSRRAEIGPELDRLFSRFADSGFSGTVLLALGDTVVLEQGYGMADRERRIPATAATRYSTAGITKLFTAAAILALEADGRLSVTDSLTRWTGPLPGAKGGVSLHHLLTHTDGLTRLQAPVYRREAEAFVEAVAQTPAAFAPGSGYRYNDFGHSLLGMVVERAAGESYEAFIRRRFLDPAGMHASGFEREGGPLAVEYAGTADRLTPIPPRAYTWGRRGSLGLVSTAGDLFRWFRAMHDPRILTPAVRQRMVVPREQTDWGAEQAYGWDIQPRPGGRRIWRRVAGTPGFEGEILHDPAAGWTAVILVNSRLGWRFRIWNAIERAVLLQPDVR